MISPRITRALNPHRKLSLAQIRAGFGGKRRQASIKAKRHKHKAPKRRAAAKSSNPKKRKRRATAKRRNAQKKVVYRTRYKTKTVVKKVYAKRKRKATAKRRNPVYLATLAPVAAGNPKRKRRKSNMAKTKRRASAKGRSRKSNPTRRRSAARRRSNHRPRSRNPFDSGLAKGIVGGAVAFSIGKKVPPMLGATANSSAMMSLATTAGVGLATYWAAKKFAPAFAQGAAIGAGMAVLNVAISAWAPPSIAGYSALGDFMRFPPGTTYPLPYNAFTGMGVPQLNAPAMAAPPSNQTQVNMGAWGSPWGQ